MILIDFIHVREPFYNASTNFSRFNEMKFNTFSEAYSVYPKTILEDHNISKDPPELEKTHGMELSYKPH